MARGNRWSDSINGLLEGVILDSEDFVDKVADRAKDVDRNGRKAVRRVVGGNGNDRRDHSSREIHDLRSALDDLTAKVNKLVALQAEERKATP